ncbi:MAG: DUF4166 domain-containing protein, partial [Albidovulum sp.]
PVPLRRSGKDATGIGLGESLRYTIAPPGELPLPNTRFSLVDVPDLQLIPAAMPDITDIWIGAGPVPEGLHRMLNLLARLRYRLRLPSLTRLAPLCHRVLNARRSGPHRGGMFVEAEGDSGGKPLRQSWHLVAESDDGPLIPSMAIEAIIRKVKMENRPAPGARAALSDISLADYQVLFRRRRISYGWREAGTGGALYHEILGDRFVHLPQPMQALHSPGARAVWRGRADVTRGQGWLAAIIAGLFRFPRAAEDIALDVTLTTNAKGVETWTRDFAGRRMRSRQRAGRGRDAHLIVERFGPVAISMALVIQGDSLALVPRRWRLFGIAMPKRFLPTGDTHESAAEGRFRFHVEIALPYVGPVVCYDGWLEPA